MNILLRHENGLEQIVNLDDYYVTNKKFVIALKAIMRLLGQCSGSLCVIGIMVGGMLCLTLSNRKRILRYEKIMGLIDEKR